MPERPQQCWGFESMSLRLQSLATGDRFSHRPPATEPAMFTRGCLRSARLHSSGLLSLFSSKHTEFYIFPSAYSLKIDYMKFGPIYNNSQNIIILIGFFYHRFNCLNMTISLKPIRPCNVIYCIMCLNTVEFNK